MTKKETVAFFIIALCGGYGFAIVMTRVFHNLLSDSPIAFGGLSAIFYFLALWFYEDIRKQYKIRDEERAAVLKQDRRKKSLVLSRHPLLESPSDTHGIKSMHDLDLFFEINWEDADKLDYDQDGHYIFQDHKYIRG